MKILGISHPLPTEIAERIYNNGKTVFVGKPFLGNVYQGISLLYMSLMVTKLILGGLISKLLVNRKLVQFTGNIVIN